MFLDKAKSVSGMQTLFLHSLALDGFPVGHCAVHPGDDQYHAADHGIGSHQEEEKEIFKAKKATTRSELQVTISPSLVIRGPEGGSS